jgi:hypothetical protein
MNNSFHFEMVWISASIWNEEDKSLKVFADCSNRAASLPGNKDTAENRLYRDIIKLLLSMSLFALNFT